MTKRVKINTTLKEENRDRLINVAGGRFKGYLLDELIEKAGEKKLTKLAKKVRKKS